MIQRNRRTMKLIDETGASVFAHEQKKDVAVSMRLRSPKKLHCIFAYPALASFSMGMSGSASFQRVRKSLYAASALTRAASASASAPSRECLKMIVDCSFVV